MASPRRVSDPLRRPPRSRRIDPGKATEALVARLGSRLASPTGVVHVPFVPRPPFGRVVGRIALAGLTLAVNGCVPQTQAGGLAPTLSMSEVPGGTVAMQDGIPVPSFEIGPRPRIDLDGAWRVEQATFDSDLSLTPRDVALPRIVAGSGGREKPGFDDSGWSTVDVPGTVNPPPGRREIGAWYRRTVAVPAVWSGQSITIKFGAVNYIADVWVNGTWLGYHEGGYTPFAFDATAAIHPGEQNLIAVRVDNPAWGTRNDIVPWGLADWWNFGGITRSAWLEASNPLHVVRADVVPHLDGADVSVVLENRSDAPAAGQPIVEILPARVTDANLLNPDARSLVASTVPVARQTLEVQRLGPRGVVRLDTSFVLGVSADHWSPGTPALYVVRVVLVPPPVAATPSPSPGATPSPAGSSPGVEQPGVEQPGAEQPSPGSPGVEQPGASSPSAGSAPSPETGVTTGSHEGETATPNPSASPPPPLPQPVFIPPVGGASGAATGGAVPGPTIPPTSPSGGGSASGRAPAPFLVPFDEIDESFGLRQIAVDPTRAGLRLNGQVVTFDGVNLHDQRVEPGTAGIAGGIVSALPTAAEILGQLDEARSVNARLVRTGHTPADPNVLRLADRLGFGIWEEIPLYHYTPLTFGIAMSRGIPQQMLREMVLRDMNHPSVLFHGLANESTGGDERASALTTLSRIDHELDGTRLTGQAAFGFSPTDDTSQGLDVAGFTFYYGVFYGTDPAVDTARALEEAHAAYPDKPLMILEFGRWADPPDGPSEQVRIFNATAGAMESRMAVEPRGFVAGRLWWSLEDYVTMRPTIEIERFGMFAPDGSPRPVATAAARLFGPVPAAEPGSGTVTSGRQLPPAEGSTLRLLAYLAYAGGVTIVLLGALLLVQVLWGGRAGSRSRPRGAVAGAGRRTSAGDRPGADSDRLGRTGT